MAKVKNVDSSALQDIGARLRIALDELSGQAQSGVNSRQLIARISDVSIIAAEIENYQSPAAPLLGVESKAVTLDEKTDFTAATPTGEAPPAEGQTNPAATADEQKEPPDEPPADQV